MLEGLRNILVVNGAVVWMGVGVDSRVVMTGDIFHLSTVLFVWQVVQLLLVVGLGCLWSVGLEVRTVVKLKSRGRFLLVFFRFR